MERLTNAQFADLHSFTELGSEFIFCHSKKEFSNTVRAFGPGRKDTDTDGLIFRPAIAGALDFKVYGFKTACCECVQVGQKIVPGHAEQVIPAEPERIEPVYEWICAPFLEAAGAEVE